MATRKRSAVEETRQRAQEMETDEKRIGALDSRSEQERGDPWRSTFFLLAIVGVTIVLCLIVMLALAGG
jgi:CHASE3 domain sensor protein